MTSYTKLAEQVTSLSGKYTSPQQLHAWATRGTVNTNGVPFPGLDSAEAIAAWAASGTRDGPRPKTEDRDEGQQPRSRHALPGVWARE